MRTRTSIFIGITATVVAMAVVAFFVWRIFFERVVTLPISGGVRTSETVGLQRISYDLHGFSRILASGAWELILTRESTYSVSVEVPAGLASKLEVQKSGQTLIIGLRPGVTLSSRQRMRAQVSMPELEGVELSGANRASLSGFSGDRLSLVCSGAASVVGRSGEYQTVEVDGSGASTVLLSGLTTVNADVQMSGAGKAELEMRGGRLTGSLTGAASITYRGTVASQTVQTSGVATVTHR